MSEQQSDTTTATETGDKWGGPISEERQSELDALSEQQRTWAGQPAEARGDSPFKGVHLSGADVFWLAKRALAGPEGDVAALAAAETRLRSRDPDERLSLDLSALHLEQVGLRDAHLEGANLERANLEGARLRDAHLEGAGLYGAHLERANLSDAHLEGAGLLGANLEDAFCIKAHLEGADLRNAQMKGADLSNAHLEDADLTIAFLNPAILVGAHLERANLSDAHLEGADLIEAHLEGAHLTVARLHGAMLLGAYLKGADLSLASLERANLRETYMERAILHGAHLEGANLEGANLEGADLTATWFDKASHLNNVTLTGVSLDQTSFDNTNLTVVDWSLVKILGDERTARTRKDADGKPKGHKTQLEEYKSAVRANRVLAVAVRGQGMNEDADRFAYRAQLLQQQVLRRQRKVGSYIFSRLLDGLAGYGYKPVRGLIAYLVVILGFAFAYGLATHGILTFGLPRSSIQPLQWYEALVLSISSFHGRGFFQPVQSLGDPVAIIAAVEAIIGLLIEISFIATFTQRFFGR